MVCSRSPATDSFTSVKESDELGDADNNLQPFFVLHKASHRKSSTKSSASGRAKKKTGVQSSSPRPRTQGLDDASYERLRLKAFDQTWSKIDSTVKEVLKKININLFEEIHRWVRQSFSTTRPSCPSEITKPYPIVSSVICKRIPTALVFTRNVEFVDNLLTFRDLKDHMQSHGCHVAFLSAFHLSSKHGVGGCLRSLCRQLVSETSDASAAVPLIASWYSESENYHNPIVIIIDDMERCDGAVLADFVKMLSEWVMKIPFIFVMGVTTAIDAPRRLLPSIVLHNLLPCNFTLESPARIMDSIIESILVKSNLGFFVGHNVAVFLRNYFFRHDGTITAFLKALKFCSAKHFERESLSFLCPGMLLEDSEIGEEVRELYSIVETTTIGGPLEGNQMDNILRQHTSPTESIPFRETVCFNDVASLKLALIGDPRRIIQHDLLKFDELLQSISCDNRENRLSSFTHDTVIMYSLAQEYGELINLHDWYVSFKTKILHRTTTTSKRKIPHSRLPAKSKAKKVENEATIQARFCKAVIELQITGLVRMPSKRRPDFLQRIAFDL